MRPTLILLHGWGFDASLWDAVADALSDVSIVRWDRGYFGRVEQGAVEGPVAGVGHSLGAMLLAELLPSEAPLIAINGFDHFTGADGVPLRVVERMQGRFAETPETVLTEFRARCGAGPTEAELNADRLADDLAVLASHHAAPTRRPILSLQGGMDPILPQCLRAHVFPGAERATLEEAGHLLPITHPAWCAQQIEALLCR